MYLVASVKWYLPVNSPKPSKQFKVCLWLS
ncbi:Uncharacterised protein [Vibrio cholerae]|nr:Uncharacterised protein [Vibrio cholerae]